MEIDNNEIVNIQFVNETDNITDRPELLTDDDMVYSSNEDDSSEVKSLKPGPGKKTRGRIKLKMKLIKDKVRRYTTFSKRKNGIMKKAYELATLTGAQIVLLVASETGHVYTFATKKLQPVTTSPSGKALIVSCLSNDIENQTTNINSKINGSKEFCDKSVIENELISNNSIIESLKCNNSNLEISKTNVTVKKNSTQNILNGLTNEIKENSPQNLNSSLQKTKNKTLENNLLNNSNSNEKNDDDEININPNINDFIKHHVSTSNQNIAITFSNSIIDDFLKKTSVSQISNLICNDNQNVSNKRKNLDFLDIYDLSFKKIKIEKDDCNDINLFHLNNISSRISRDDNVQSKEIINNSGSLKNNEVQHFDNSPNFKDYTLNENLISPISSSTYILASDKLQTMSNLNGLINGNQQLYNLCRRFN